MNKCQRRAREYRWARNHQATTSVSTITGMMTASMINGRIVGNHSLCSAHWTVRIKNPLVARGNRHRVVRNRDDSHEHAEGIARRPCNRRTYPDFHRMVVSTLHPQTASPPFGGKARAAQRSNATFARAFKRSFGQTPAFTSYPHRGGRVIDSVHLRSAHGVVAGNSHAYRRQRGLNQP
jgi:hypothetical protein